MRVFVTGATGFVGGHVLARLLTEGHEAVCLVRDPARLGALRDRVTVKIGDVTKRPTLGGALTGCDAVIHLVGLRREFSDRGLVWEELHTEATRNVVIAAKAEGVRRFIHMSANGASPTGSTRYFKTKAEAEEIVRASGIPWVIFRPTLLWADDGGFAKEIRAMIRRFRAFPCFGLGDYAFQPIRAPDVARAFEAALTNDAATERVFHLGGPLTTTWRDILGLLAKDVKGPTLILPVPKGLILFLARRFGKHAWFPASEDELTMLFKGSVVPERDFEKVFGFEAKPCWGDFMLRGRAEGPAKPAA